MPIDSFADLMTRLRAGDQNAAAELFQRFAGRLILLARDRLGPLVKGKVDPEDIVQSALRSFFVRHADGRIAPRGWGGLWAILTTITLRKCGHQVDYWTAACRDVRREAIRPADDLSDPGWLMLASDPTPSQAAILVETVRRIEADLEEYHRDIFRLALGGYKSPEIANRVRVTERTVQRVLKRIRERLEGLAAA
jgi:RNA polymerase sigma-70 factor (ECF subfamily)